MRVLLLIISLIPGLLKAQYPEGANQTVTRSSGYSYKIFTPVGYSTADPSKVRFLVNFVGDGESQAYLTENTVLGKYIGVGNEWDGRMVLSNGDTLYIIVLTIPNYGVIPGEYSSAITTFMNSFTKLDKENNSYHAITGYSGGPGRALTVLTYESFTYRSLFKRGLFISPTWSGISDYSWSTGGYWHVWYSSNDPNSGTPPGAATDLYSKLNGTKKITALSVACHCATIWDSAMTITGVKNLYRADETYNSTNNRIRWMFAPDDDGSGNIPDPPDPPAWDTSIYYPIIIDTNENIGNIGWNKTPQAWFDTDTTAVSRLDKDGGVNSIFSTPYVILISLNDSSYGNFQFRLINGYSTGTISIELYDSNRVRIDSSSFSRGNLNSGWATVGNWDRRFQNLNTPVRFIKFTVPDPTNTDIREFQMRGLGIARNTPVKPDYTGPTARPDPGIKYQGISAIDDRDTSYMKMSTGEAFFGSYRQPMNVFFSVYDISKTRGYQKLAFHYFGDIALRKLNFMKNKGVQTQLYYNGGWLGAKGDGTDSTAEWDPKAAANKYKDIDKGADSTSYTEWAKGSAKLFKAATKMFGNNPDATLDTSYIIYKIADQSAGQDKIQILEIGNEDNQTWNGLTAFHSVPVAVEKLKSSYDSVKSVDPNMQVYIGATYYADTIYLKAMYWWHYWKYGERQLPADGFCFNQYLSDAYSGQPHGWNTNSAVTPEQFRVDDLAQGMANYRDGWQPGNGINWTESGFARAATNSNYKVKVIEGIPDTILMANLNIRLFERVATVKNGIDVMYNYFFSSDGSTHFGTMVLTTQVLDEGVYKGSIRHPNWYWFSTRHNTVKHYKAWSDMIRDGDSTSYTITRRDHLSDENKKLFYVCLGTYEGASLGETSIDLGENVQSARLVEFVYGSETGEITELEVSDSRYVNVQVDEHPRYIEVTYGSDPGPAPINKISKPAGTRWNLKPVQN